MGTKKYSLQKSILTIAACGLFLTLASCSKSGGTVAATPTVGIGSCGACGGLTVPIGNASGTSMDATPVSFQLTMFGNASTIGVDPTVSALTIYSGPIGVAGQINIPSPSVGTYNSCNLAPGSYSLTTMQPGMMSSGEFTNLVMQATGPESFIFQMNGMIVDPTATSYGNLVEGGHIVVNSANGTPCSEVFTY